MSAQTKLDAGGVVITDQESLMAAWAKWEDLEFASNCDLTPEQYRAIHDQQIAIELATDEYHRLAALNAEESK